jgi:hypothetical protein
LGPNVFQTAAWKNSNLQMVLPSAVLSCLMAETFAKVIIVILLTSWQRYRKRKTENKCPKGRGLSTFPFLSNLVA